MKMQTKSQDTENSKQSGFNLLEVLFVLLIMTIIGMVAMPMYQNYMIRTKINSELLLMRPVMVQMKEKFALYEKWPSSNEEAGAKEPSHYNGKYLMSVEISDDPQPGTMTLTYNAEELPVLLGTDTLVFYPTGSAGNASWQCDQGTLPSKYRPDNC